MLGVPFTLCIQVNLFVALAPIVTLRNQQSKLLKALKDSELSHVISLLGNMEFVPGSSEFQQLDPLICGSSLMAKACGFTMDLVTGPVSASYHLITTTFFVAYSYWLP